MGRIVVAGSFDSKAVPLGLLTAMLRAKGENPIIIDTAVYPDHHVCDFPARIVAARAGMKAEEVAALGRAKAVSLMSQGAATILRDLVSAGEVSALVCMGGSNAATVFSHLAPVLPLGIPKILMATVVAGDTRPFMAANDVILIYPVVDVDGDNPIMRRMIARLADTAVAAKSERPLGAETRVAKAVAMTMFGVTTPCVQRVREHLERDGIDAFIFHANGTGGRTIETFAAQRMVDGIVDATITELADELFGGALPAGADRLINAARAGIPQVLAPGAIDMINFGPRSTVPSRFDGRNIIAHNDLVTLVRTTAQECFEIGRVAAQRLGKPSARAVMCVPLGGVSMLDKPGAPFWDPDAVHAFRDGFKAHADASVEMIDTEHNINDPAFADLLHDRLRAVMPADHAA